MKRQRGRNRRSGGGNQNPNRHYESNGPDVKIRGSAQQILDKYLQYARDSQTSGDRVMSEAYFQHAEHYQRLIMAMQPKDRPKRERNEDDDDGRDDDNRNDADDGDDNDHDSDDDDRSDRNVRNDRSERSERNDRSDRNDRSERPAARRKRSPRDEDTDSDDNSSNKDDPLKVVDEESEAEASRPRRRRPYKKRDDESGDASSGDDGSDDANDGVMKTLSRGRRKVAEDAEPVDSAD